MPQKDSETDTRNFLSAVIKVWRWCILLCLVLAVGGTAKAWAEVNFNVSIGAPPVVVAEPRGVILVPGSEVYFSPERVDVFFYHGYWWNRRGDRWYRGRGYNGPWSFVDHRFVPHPVYGMPRDYRTRYARERRIPYGQWKKEHWERAARQDRHDHDHGHGYDHEREGHRD